MEKTELCPLQIEDKIIEIRNQKVILDCDVAMLYGVETRRVNEAVKRNPDKFPEGYVFSVQSVEIQKLVANCDRFENVKHSSSTKAFTEKGLYMLATILKSQRATQATITIVETFAKLRELSSNLIALSTADPETIEPEVIEKTGGLFNDLFLSNLPTTASETSLEFNLGFMKGKRILKSEPNSAIQQELAEIKNMIKDIQKH